MLNPLDPGYYGSAELRSFGFKAVGENVRISKLATIAGPERIEIGDNVRIDAFTAIIVASGWVKMGSHIHIATGCLIGARGGVTFADFSGISHGVRLFTATDDCSGHVMMSYEVPAELTNVAVAPISIGRHALVSANSVVLPGVALHEGAVVGALSLVKESLPPWAVYAGVPARKIRDRSRRAAALEAVVRMPVEHRAIV